MQMNTRILVGLMITSTSIHTAQADMCQDFCLQELGRAGCTKGSWCKNNHDCHSLFHTSADLSTICVFTGSGSCTNRFPVLCDDARVRTQGGAVTTRAPELPPVFPPRVPFEVKPTPPKPVITTRTPEQARATIGSRVNPGRDVHRKASPTKLVLHFNPFEYDPRPRTTMSFIANGQDIGFSVMFDTGSDTSHILEYKETAEYKEAIEAAPPSYIPIDGVDQTIEPVTRPAKLGEGYQNVGLVQRTGEARNLYYGTDDALRPVESNGRINEFAVLYSGEQSFAYEIEIELTKKVDNDFTGIGLLGAGRTSHLAQTAGIFSYLGPIIDYTGWATSTAGTLFIGERDLSVLNSHCLRGQELRFFPTRTQISRIHWAVGGSVTMNDVVGSETARADMNWIVDTGAHGLFVTTEMKDAIRQAMLVSGAVLISDKPGTLAQYRNCPSAEVMPSFTFYMGTGAQAVPVILTANDYLRTVFDRPGVCYLEVSDSTASHSARLIGTQVLSKLLTVFDAENDRIGFCNTRL